MLHACWHVHALETQPKDNERTVVAFSPTVLTTDGQEGVQLLLLTFHVVCSQASASASAAHVAQLVAERQL
jgi:hypothetical protein